MNVIYRKLVDYTTGSLGRKFRELICVIMSSRESTPKPHPLSTGLFRTRICKFGDSCHYGDRCFYAHSEEQIRPRDGSASSTPACTVSDSVRKASRRSSAVLSEINQDVSSFVVESVQGRSRRGSGCHDSVENSGSLGLPPSAVCVIGAIIPNLCDISRSSYESARDSSATGSVSPLSVASSGAREEPIMCSYYYFCVLYLLHVHRPEDLTKMLQEAAPQSYTD